MVKYVKMYLRGTVMDYDKIREINDSLARDCLFNIAVFINVNASEKDRNNMTAVCGVLADRIIELENTIKYY